MMKRLCAALVFLLILTAAISAQDRIAVLDTELPKGIDTKVVIPITEKIMEEFVRSKLFIVLDRSFIAKTLSELEFSTSDLTAGDTDKLATIGGFLKATYIVVSTVQLLDRTYFLSAKMIEVKSGVIVAQSSVNRDGSVSVLIDMAGELGQKLVSAAMGQDVKSGGRTATQQTVPATTKKPVKSSPDKETSARPELFSSVTVDFGFGATVANETDSTDSFYTFDAGDYDAVSGSAYEISIMLPFGLFYFSANAGITTAVFDGTVANIETSNLLLGLGFGLDVPVGPVLLYAGIRGGYMSFNSLEYYYLSSTSYDTTYSGLSGGFEIGADVKLGIFVVGLRYITDTGTLFDDLEVYPDIDVTTGALSVRAGIAF